jgi:hypothetical protein
VGSFRLAPQKLAPISKAKPLNEDQREISGAGSPIPTLLDNLYSFDCDWHLQPPLLFLQVIAFIASTEMQLVACLFITPTTESLSSYIGETP